jgi:hypothetical protein
MAIGRRVRWGVRAVLGISFLLPRASAAEPIPVKYVEGAIHGFVTLRTETGKAIAVGDLDQTVKGARVTTNLKFRFHDGSVYAETTIFSQRGAFRLLSDHLIESGPAFKRQMEVWIDCRSGQVRVRETKNGKDDVTNQHVDLPADLANGMVEVLVKNLPEDGQRTVSMLAATPKPRIVKLAVTPDGEEAFSIEGMKYSAKRYVGKIEIGGVAGVVAPVVGEKPPDIHFWIFKGESPVVLKSVGPLSADTPVWQIEMASPVWAGNRATADSSPPLRGGSE